MSNVPAELQSPLVELLLAVADDKLILGHRNADWTGLAPILEEDIAFSALAQDDIAHARALYELIAELTGDDPDRLAFGRPPAEYRCAEIVTLSDEFDWAVALVRQFFCDHFEKLRLTRLAHSAYTPLAELAHKMSREEALAIGHADQWIVRLCRATDESRQRIVKAFELVTPLSPTLFEPTEGQERLEAAGLYPELADRGSRIGVGGAGIGQQGTGNTEPERAIRARSASEDSAHGIRNLHMFEQWEEMVANVIEDAGLHLDLPRPDPAYVGGRRGRHGPQFAEMLAEMTEVYRGEPNAKW